MIRFWVFDRVICWWVARIATLEVWRSIPRFIAIGACFGAPLPLAADTLSSVPFLPRVSPEPASLIHPSQGVALVPDAGQLFIPHGGPIQQSPGPVYAFIPPGPFAYPSFPGVPLPGIYVPHVRDNDLVDVTMRHDRDRHDRDDDLDRPVIHAAPAPGLAALAIPALALVVARRRKA